MQATIQLIEQQIREYAEHFLKTEFGDKALNKIEVISITAVDAYDPGGISEVTERKVRIAVRRDMDAGKLTGTTKLILRHELGHIMDVNSPAFPDFEEEIKHEKIAWSNAKPKNPAENWYKNLSIRTHIDPLKMQSKGFPRPETRVTQELLEQGTNVEVARMKQGSLLADEYLAKRFAMANLVVDQSYYDRGNFLAIS